MAFEAKEYNIFNLFSQNVLEIPRNQRKYVWNLDNWKDLLSDIEFIVNNDSKRKHFLGSVVLRKEDSINGIDKYSIIDGQQRTITIIILLLSLIKIFKENNLDADVEGTLQYLYIKDRKNNERFVLNSEYHLGLKDLADAIKNEDGRTPLNKIFKDISLSSKSKKFKDAFEFFYTALKKKQESNSIESLIDIRDSLLDTKYIRINTDTDEDAYTVFEILNARGQTLEDYELLKNYIMRYILPKEKVDEVKQKWSEIEDCLGANMKKFFSHYVTHYIGSSDTKDIYRTIQDVFPKDKVSALLKDLYRKAHLYQIIINPSKSRNPEEYRILSYLKSKRSVQLRPLLLSLLSAFESGSITKEEYIASLQFLQNFFICFTIISSEKSNKLTEIINKYSRMIERTPSSEVLTHFHNSLKLKLPSFDTFCNTFKELGYSKHYDYYRDSSKKAQVTAALDLIENHLSPGFSSIDSTIEHINPDSLDKGNATIGNLTLLEKNINKDCEDKLLSYKIDKYSDSNFRMTRNIYKRYHSNPSSFNIESRAEALAKMIYKDIFKFDIT